MTTNNAVDLDKFGAMLEATVELRPEEKRIVADLEKAVQAGLIAFEQWDETRQTHWHEKHVQEQDRVVELMNQITKSDCRPEILLQAEKVFIHADLDRYAKDAEADGPFHREVLAWLAERKNGLSEATLAERLLGIRRLPLAYKAMAATHWPNFRLQAAPWEDQVTKYCSYELAFLNGHYPFWGGGSGGAHATREIMVLRREALHKFIQLYLKLRSQETLTQDVQLDAALDLPSANLEGKSASAKDRLDIKPAFGAANLPDEIADEIVILFDAYAQVGVSNMTAPGDESQDDDSDRPWLLPEQQFVFLGDLLKIISNSQSKNF